MRLPFGIEVRRHRQVSHKRGVYRSAEVTAGEISDLVADWTVGCVVPDEVIRHNLTRVRARSREQYRNNPYVRKFMRMVVKNVPGPDGIGFQGRIKNLDGTDDVVANAVIEEAWAEWSLSKACDIEGRLTFPQQQHLFVNTAGIDGETVVRMLQGREFGPFGFALQFIDSELLDVHLDKELPNGNFIRLGIEYNQYNRPIAYHFLPPDRYMYRSAPMGIKHERVPASQIIHGFITEEVGQRRALPWTTTALLRLKMLGGLDEAALIHARLGASNVGFFEHDPESPPYKGDAKDRDGAPIEEFEPGTIRDLPPGVKFSGWDPQYPDKEYAPFHSAMLLGITCGFDVSYTGLSGDLSKTNFSSGRLGRLDEQDTYRYLQGWQISDFNWRVFLGWLDTQLILGNLKVKGVPFDVSRRRKYQRVEWQPRGWDGVDQLKEVQADVLRVEHGFDSRSAIIRRRGRDPQEVLNEIVLEDAAAEKKGKKFPRDGGSVEPTPSQEEKEEKEE